MSAATDTPRGSSSDRSRGSSRTRLQSLLGVVLVVAVALAPLPLGSNRPVFWALGALLCGLAALLYFGLLAARGHSMRVAPRWMRGAMLAGAAYLGWTIVQVLPLGLILGSFETTLPSGLTLSHDTLSLTPGPTTLAALRVAGYGMLFVLALQVAANRDRSKKIMQALFFIVTGWALYALLALVQFGDNILVFEKWAYFGSATGPFVNRNSFATFLAMGMIAGLGLVAERATRQGPAAPGGRLARMTDATSLHVYLMAIMALLVMATLFQTNSRMGVFAGLLGASLTLVLIVARRLKLRRRTLILVPVAMALTGAAVAWLYGGVLFERLGRVGNDANVRLTVYDQVLGMIAQRPLTGWGADSFEVVYRAFRTAPASVELSWARAHSTYLSHWVETGVIAGSIPLLLVGWAFVACLHAALTRSSDIVLPAIGAGVIFTGSVHSLVDFSLEMQANVWLFVVILALALGGHRPQAAHAAKTAQTRTDTSSASPSGASSGNSSRKRRRRRSA